MTHISDIKLIRTDTTLDLSQKAEKGMLYVVQGLSLLYQSSPFWLLLAVDVGFPADWRILCFICPFCA
ncbi:hypothetical protein A4A49_24111 [Nicotiana attenuata]|uniref:Uncharacterized protein n=1 Tax=Nicotiana attenuata TaxID=49451 RepID=A0A314KJ92_NICAT|nr:hypothetical protein A4A49_24111 [Nicotiana attenuata]